MKTDIECGACTKQLTLEHWKECLGIQCKCLHYRKKHGKYGGDCKRRGNFVGKGYCTCIGFEPLLKFDDFFGWSKSVKPEILYTPQGIKTGVTL